MFNKIFKYDFKFVFRFWWIYAVITVGLSVVGGGLLRGIIEYISAGVSNPLIYILAFLAILTAFCVGVLVALSFHK